MARWNRILIVATLVALGPAVVAHSRGGTPRDQAAVEDALLLRLGDALDSSASAEKNAAAMAVGLRAELCGCGAVQVEGARVSLDASGCTLPDGMQLGEPLSLVVHRSARGLTVVLSEGPAATPARGPVDAQASAQTAAARR